MAMANIHVHLSVKCMYKYGPVASRSPYSIAHMLISIHYSRLHLHLLGAVCQRHDASADKLF